MKYARSDLSGQRSQQNEESRKRQIEESFKDTYFDETKQGQQA